MPARDVERVPSPAAIRRAASRAAQRMTSRRQVVADAVTIAVEQWENAIMAGKQVSDWLRWASRVAANAVKRLAPRTTMQQQEAGESLDAQPRETRFVPNASRRSLLAVLAQRKDQLRGRQFEVVCVLTREGMSIHRAAKELCMSRFNVRRAFRSALRRLSTPSK